MNPALAAGVTMVGDLAGGAIQANRNKGAQKKQYQLNSKLQEEAQKLSMKTWNETNYETQAEHMRNAGLNVGMMYGMGGGGGATTNAGSGSSVGMPTYQNTGMGLDKAMGVAQLGLIDAQKENIQADTENKKAGATNLGADTAKKGAETTNIGATTALTNLQAENQKTLNNIQNQTIEYTVDTIAANYHKAEAEAGKALAEAKIAPEMAKEQLKQARQESLNKALQAQVMKAGIKLTEEQTRAISENLAQGWEELYQTSRRTDVANQQNKIQHFIAKSNDAIGKANVDLRAKEVLIKGAGEFARAFLNKGNTESTTSKTEYDKQGNYKGESHTTTKYK